MTERRRLTAGLGLGLLTLTSLGCASFREVAPPPGTELDSRERSEQVVRRELEFGGLRPANWIAAGEKWARDVTSSLDGLRPKETEGPWRLGIAETVNQSGLPATSFTPLHYQLMLAWRRAAERNGLVLVPGVLPGSPEARQLDGVVTQRVIGDVRSGDRFTLIYELERTARP